MVSLKFSRENNFSESIERRRLLSDNYNAYLIPKRANGSRIDDLALNLGELGLKEVSWEARDEVNIFKPITRREEICIVECNGFDFDLKFGKNSSDLMYLWLGQHALYHGQKFGLDVEKKTFRRESEAVKLGEQLKTPNFRQENIKISDVVSVWHDLIRHENLVPTYDLKINIQHFNTLIETYYFKEFSFYKPKQNVSENSSEIEESVKGFASWVELGGTELPSLKSIKILQESYDRLINSGFDSVRQVNNNDNIKLLSEKQNKI